MSGSGRRAAIESLPKRKPDRPKRIPTFRVNMPAIHRVFGAAVELPRKDTDEDPGNDSRNESIETWQSDQV